MKFLITESEKHQIKKMYGLIKEQSDGCYCTASNPCKPCKKCIGSYGGKMNDCAYYAIERFEENYGTGGGTSMGDNYFEGNWKRYNQRIVSRIVDTIGESSWSSMSSKFQMQLWSFMYNSDSDSSVDHYKWLAVLYLTALGESFDETKTLKIINKKNTPEWKKAVDVVSKFTNWNSVYDNFVRMLDGQYETLKGSRSRPGAWQRSWRCRPSALSKMYDDCISGKSKKKITYIPDKRTIKKPSEIIKKPISVWPKHSRIKK